MVKEIVIGSTLALFALLVWWGIDVTPIVLLGGLAIFFRFALDMRTGGRGGQTPGRHHAAVADVSFDDIGGQDVAKRELMEALDFVNRPDAAKNLGIRPLRGILLTGPPGTGKTLMAKAAAQYSDAAFFSASGSEFVEMYAGVGSQRIRRLFRDARRTAEKEGKKSAVVFIDEIEVLGGKRGREGGHMEYDQTLNELLVQLDGIGVDEENVTVLVMAATNRPDLLDEALLRPGRIDRTVIVDMPDMEGRLHILRIHTRRRPVDDSVDLNKIAKESYGLSGADLENVVNEAAIFAIRDGRTSITDHDLKEAIEKVMMGEKLERRLRSEERERVAYHEAGHAFISEIVRPGSVTSVTITSRGKALGYMRRSPSDDPYLYTKQELLDEVAIAVAGTCAEQVFFGSRSTGATGDIEQVMKIAAQIIAGGMSSLGVVNMEMVPPKVLHEEMRAIVQERERFVLGQLESFRKDVQRAADLLLEKERLSGGELRDIVGLWDEQMCPAGL